MKMERDGSGTGGLKKISNTKVFLHTAKIFLTTSCFFERNDLLYFIMYKVILQYGRK